MTLRRGFTTAMYVLCAAFLAVAVAFVLITTKLSNLTREVGSAVLSVQFAEEAQVALLLHSRASDRVVRTQLAGQLQSELRKGGEFVTSEEERRVYDAAARAVDAYLRDAGERGAVSTKLLDQAFAALEELVRANVRDTQAAEERAARWSMVSDVVASFIALSFVSVVFALLWWVRRKVIRPVLAVSAAMEAFRVGDRRSRAPVEGPEEVAIAARRYNEMADEIGSERDRLQAFLGSVAHDLRNPLSALKLTLSRPPEPDAPPEKLVKTMTRVRRQIERLDRMIGDLVDAARIERGELEIKKGQADACALAEEVVNLFEATSPHHQLRLNCPGAPVLIEVDASRVAQVLNNLVSNAIKYSPEGGQVVVSVQELPERNEVVFRVTDQGIGMTPEEVREIFLPFRRVGVSREEIPGVGLGLFAVHRIVEAHGGTVTVTSEPGRGSTFEVWLPKQARP